MLYREFKQMSREAWIEKFNFLCIHMTKKKNEDKYRIFNESKNTYNECICESESFWSALFKNEVDELHL